MEKHFFLLPRRSQRWQVLEKRAALGTFLSDKAAAHLLLRGQRRLLVLTYGLGALEEPDPIGTVLAHVLRFLEWLCYNHNVREAEQHSYGVLWDYASLHQKPRDTAEGQAFGQALKVMADLYASPFGSCVMQHRLMPPRRPELDGVVL